MRQGQRITAERRWLKRVATFPRGEGVPSKFGYPEGIQARKEGKHHSANPYTDMDGRPLRLFRGLYRDWRAGWEDQARAEALVAIPLPDLSEHLPHERSYALECAFRGQGWQKGGENGS